MEIMVTMVIMTMVTLLIYGAMTDQHRSFFTIMKRSDAIRESVHTKRKVDSIIKEIDSVLTVNRVFIEYRDTLEKRHRLHIRSGVLYKNSDSLSGNIEASEFSIEESECGVQTLLWGLTFKNGYWIGGARNFY